MMQKMISLKIYNKRQKPVSTLRGETRGLAGVYLLAMLVYLSAIILLGVNPSRANQESSLSEGFDRVPSAPRAQSKAVQLGHLRHLKQLTGGETVLLSHHVIISQPSLSASSPTTKLSRHRQFGADQHEHQIRARNLVLQATRNEGKNT